MAMPTSITSLLEQLGMAPLGLPIQSPPATEEPGYVPFDTSGAMGEMPYNGIFPPPVPDPGDIPSPDDSMGDTNMDAAAGSEGLYGYSPQPRAALPRPLTKGPGSDLFANYTGTYNPPADETDPLTKLMANVGGQPAATADPRNRSLTPPWAAPAQANPEKPQYGAGAGQRQIQQAAQDLGPTKAEQALLRKSPAYARTIARLRTLDQLRAKKGI